MFHCLPDGSKCEWGTLRPFIEYFNRKFNQEYRLAECIDVFDKSRPQPEMRLSADGSKDIVIEHKIIVWPENHLQQHRAEHDFADEFSKAVGSSFQDDIYMLEISPENIPINKKEHSTFVTRAANAVLKNINTIKTKGFYKESKPVPWSFYRLQKHERTEDTPKHGAGVIFSCDIDLVSEIDKYSESKRIDEIRKIFVSHLQKTSEKFDGHSDCVRIFITAIYSGLIGLDHKILEQILPSIEIPNNIDQVWSSYPEWVSDTEQQILYELIYESRK
jgi:hypothetical protein